MSLIALEFVAVVPEKSKSGMLLLLKVETMLMTLFDLDPTNADGGPTPAAGLLFSWAWWVGVTTAETAAAGALGVEEETLAFAGVAAVGVAEPCNRAFIYKGKI